MSTWRAAPWARRCGGAPGKWYYVFAVQNSRQSRRNIDLNKECVISYYPKALIRESIISSFPVPYGISEIDLAKLTPMPMSKVGAPGIRECMVNLEAKVINQIQVSNTTIYVAEIVGMHVQTELLEQHRNTRYQPGVGGTDLLYEISINGSPPRLNYAMINLERIYPSHSDIGDDTNWQGTFESRMEAERKRGKLTEEAYHRLIHLNDRWLRDTNPATNGAVKEELTALLTDLVWRQ